MSHMRTFDFQRYATEFTDADQPATSSGDVLTRESSWLLTVMRKLSPAGHNHVDDRIPDSAAATCDDRYLQQF